MLFHRYPDGSEQHSIDNVSKTLTDTQRRYSQIQKEALAIVFALMTNFTSSYMYSGDRLQTTSGTVWIQQGPPQQTGWLVGCYFSTGIAILLTTERLLTMGC